MPHLTDEQPSNLAQAQGVLAEVYTYVGGAGWYREGSSPYAYQEASERQSQIQSNQEWIAAIFEENPEFDIDRWSLNVTPVQDLFESITGEVLGYSSPIDSASRLNVWSDYAEQGLELLGDPIRGGGAMENLSSVFSWSSFSPGDPGTAPHWRDATSWSAWLGPAGLFRDHRGHWLVCYIIGVKDEGSSGTLTANEIYYYGESGRPCAIFYNITRQEFEEKHIKFPSLHGAENRRGGGWLTMQVPAGPGGHLVTDKVVNVMTDYRPTPMRVSMPSPGVAMTFARPFAFTEGQGYPPGELWEWEGEVGKEYSSVPIAGIDVFGNSGARIARHEIRGAELRVDTNDPSHPFFRSQLSPGRQEHQSPSWCMNGTDVYWLCEARHRKDSREIVHNFEYWAARAQVGLVQWKVGTWQNTDKEAMFYSDPGHTGEGNLIQSYGPEHHTPWGTDERYGTGDTYLSGHQFPHQLEDKNMPGDDVYWAALVYTPGQLGDVSDFPWRDYYGEDLDPAANYSPGMTVWYGNEEPLASRFGGGTKPAAVQTWELTATPTIHTETTATGEEERWVSERESLRQSWEPGGGSYSALKSTYADWWTWTFPGWTEAIAEQAYAEASEEFEARFPMTRTHEVAPRVTTVVRDGWIAGAWNDPSLVIQPGVDETIPPYDTINKKSKTEFPFDAHVNNQWVLESDALVGFVCHNGEVLGTLPSLELSVDIELTTWTPTNPGDRQTAYEGQYVDDLRWADKEEKIEFEAWTQEEWEATLPHRGQEGYAAKDEVLKWDAPARGLTESTEHLEGKAMFQPRGVMGYSSKLGSPVYVGRYSTEPLVDFQLHGWTPGSADSGFHASYIDQLLHERNAGGRHSDYVMGRPYLRGTDYRDPSGPIWHWTSVSGQPLDFLRQHDYAGQREEAVQHSYTSEEYLQGLVAGANETLRDGFGDPIVSARYEWYGSGGFVFYTYGTPASKFKNLNQGIHDSDTYYGYYHTRIKYRSPMVYGETTANTLQSDPDEYEPDLPTPVTGGMGGATPEVYKPDPKNTALHHGYIWSLSGGGGEAGGPWTLQDSFVFHTTRQVAGNKYNPIYDQTPDPDSYPVHICEGPDKCMYIHMSNMYVWRWDPTGGAGNCEPTKTGLYRGGDVPLSSDPAWAAGHEAGDKWVERGKLLAAGISIPANPGVGDEAEVEDFQAGFGDTGPGQHGAGLPGDYNNDGVIDAADYTMIVDATPGIGD